MHWLAHDAFTVTSLDMLWRAWHIAHPVTVSLVVAGYVYQRGLLRLWRQAGYERGIQRGQVMTYYGALLTLFIALQSPLETLAGQFFVAHMVQHMLLILVAAPLLVISAVPVVYLWALPRSIARAITRRLNRVSAWLHAERWLLSSVTLTGAFVVVFWGWHHPRLYEAALSSAFVHSLEHAMFLITAVAFWWIVIRPGRRRNQAGQAVGGLFIAMMQGTLLGVLLVFSEQAWYAAYQNSGLDPLQDQQLAGLVMWLPGGVLYTVLAGYYFVRWLDDIDARPR